MAVLVVGGAGYIGSYMSKILQLKGYEVVVLDNLRTGHAESVKYGNLIIGDLSDTNLLEQIFKDHDFDCVLHFAAFSLVGESVIKPSVYYRNNVANTLNLLDVMLRNKTEHFIFSSTAATFGEPQYSPIDEAHPQSPINPYGSSKLMVERILKDYAEAYGLNSVCLRYFNACGADPDGELGEMHDPESHLIPLVLQAASGRRDNISIYGTDYDTKDGTCIRDYIHIDDLCSAHLLAMDALMKSKLSGACAFNLGNGDGFTVKEVIATSKFIVAADGYDIDVIDAPKRCGDPAILVADASEAKSTLGWTPKYAELDQIIRHAWHWEKTMAGII